jgi:putative transposase
MQQAFISHASSGTTILRLTKKQNACWDTALAAASPVDIPTGWEPRTKQQQWVTFADFPQCSVVFAAKYRRMVIYG